ncbi:MAG: AAA family ATPase [Thermodesulfobacteriota bacterium]
MLKRLFVRDFKSLRKVEINLPRLVILFGPNAAGKSNFLDALLALSRIATSRTLSEALSEPLRGYPIEAFAFPEGGLPSLLSSDKAEFTIEADIETGKEAYAYRYRVSVRIQPSSGALSTSDEYLAAVGKRGEIKGAPSIEKVENQIRIRRKSKPANPQREAVGLNYAILSDPRFRGAEYRAIERSRLELADWHTYYLDPRVAMREARPPSDVRDIGPLGETIAPFLFRLNAESRKHFDAVKRAVRTLIPGVEDISVDLDKRRGVLDINVKQDGKEFSSRIISEGTLRVMALCTIAANPWGGTLLAFEEPENGVHPRRLELIAELLSSIAISQRRQVIVTTHSPLLCGAIHKKQETVPGEIALMRVRQDESGSSIMPFRTLGPLFTDSEIAKALANGREDNLFESLLLRGLIDE